MKLEISLVRELIPGELAEFLTSVEAVPAACGNRGLQDIHRGGMSFRPQGRLFVEMIRGHSSDGNLTLGHVGQGGR
jgi:hypothetical protein